LNGLAKSSEIRIQTVYISANPFIGNSNDLRHKSLTHFKASDHFYKIIDAWKTNWDDDFGTVLPNAVNQVALRALEDYPDKRLILHYMQPHFPYIALGKTEVRRPAMVSIMAGYVRGGLVRVFGSDLGNRIGKIVAPNHEEWTAKKIGVDRLRQAYEYNLRVVLESVSSMLQYVNGKVVITSDHGELLGEEGKLGHPQKFKRLPQQTEVPWLEVTSISSIIRHLPQSLKNPNYLSEEDDRLVKNRLNALGYE
jgi:hypothetical protein